MQIQGQLCLNDWGPAVFLKVLVFGLHGTHISRLGFLKLDLFNQVIFVDGFGRPWYVFITMVHHLLLKICGTWNPNILHFSKSTLIGARVFLKVRMQWFGFTPQPGCNRSSPTRMT